MCFLIATLSRLICLWHCNATLLEPLLIATPCFISFQGDSCTQRFLGRIPNIFVSTLCQPSNTLAVHLINIFNIKFSFCSSKVRFFVQKVGNSFSHQNLEINPATIIVFSCLLTFRYAKKLFLWQCENVTFIGKQVYIVYLLTYTIPGTLCQILTYLCFESYLSLLQHLAVINKCLQSCHMEYVRLKIIVLQS